jgi:hypothetical protein
MKFDITRMWFRLLNQTGLANTGYCAFPCTTFAMLQFNKYWHRTPKVHSLLGKYLRHVRNEEQYNNMMKDEGNLK